ncbi:ATP-binding protein [Acuticoccus sp. MNP-M23]|uniref:ATP-binding protein n=1 Tax=Acuticoccus sp. MNP-M23 TaxID=3072793 RepID=UPI0035C08552
MADTMQPRDVSGGTAGLRLRLAAPFAAALCAAAVAAASMAAGLPEGIGIGAALAALIGAIIGLYFAGRAPLPAPPPEPHHALAVTDHNGAPLTITSAFARLMESRGLAPGIDALASDPAAAAVLFGLRRRALIKGTASGVLPSGDVVEVRADGGRLLHYFEASTASAATHEDVLPSIVDIIPAPAAIVNRDGTLASANDAFCAVAGEGATLGDGLAIDTDALTRLFAQARSRASGQIEAALRAAPERRVRIAAKPFLADRVIITLTDVTEESELEAQMAQSQKMQAIGQLAGGIAHDFNNVLTAIIGFSDLLLQNHRPSDPAFRDIMNIKQSAQRAAGLVKQLLAFSRRQTLRPTVLNLNDVIADLSMMLDRLLGEPVHLELGYGRDLWPVLADLSQIEQVVINLAVNARDAMPGGGTLAVRTLNVPAGEGALDGDGGTLEGDAVLIEIVDVGTGMPQHVLEKIFEPFFTTKATGEGTGLGLSTVYGIVKQTGGALTVDSKEGTGTTFRVYLPRATVEAKPAADTPREPSAAPMDLTGNATLLLVEDEEAIRAIAARALSAKGYHVLSAASGVEAAEIFAEEGDSIDLLLTDVIMPELDGPSLVRQVRAVRPDLKVIFMSGYADGASVDDLGGAPFLPKPFTLKLLAEAVKRELTGH